MTAIEAQLSSLTSETPQIYVASPLTGLAPGSRRQIGSDIATIKRAILSATVGEWKTGDEWPVNVYVPFEETPPWRNDDMSPAAVYKHNLEAILDSDALVVLAEKGGSAGVGQELEWSIRLGLPILFLTADAAVSRQIAGAPAFIAAQSYGGDTATLELKARHFMQQWQPLMLDGPRRRRSRDLRYAAITKRLLGAWQSCANPTGVAAQIRVDIQYLELTLRDPRQVAVMAVDTLVALGRELGVSLSSLEPAPIFVLPVPALRALMATAEELLWGENVVERLLYEGRAALETGDALDLDTMSGWLELHSRLS